MTTTRNNPFVWTTWITGLIAGDDVCRYAAWFKAHFQAYVKKASTFDLDGWKADHADVVRAVVAKLVAEGWTVTVEGQNKFQVKGEYGLLSGKPDIVAVRPIEGNIGTQARIIDVKTGQHKAKDRAQVTSYLAAMPRQRPELREVDDLAGAVYYIKVKADGSFDLDTLEIFDVAIKESMIARVWREARLATSDAEPEATPSPEECKFCDIVDCRFRDDTPVPEVDAAGAF